MVEIHLVSCTNQTKKAITWLIEKLSESNIEKYYQANSGSCGNKTESVIIWPTATVLQMKQRRISIE